MIILKDSDSQTVMRDRQVFPRQLIQRYLEEKTFPIETIFFG